MAEYNEENIRTLEWNQHIRTRPGMYIGRLGDGSAHDDGIYVLLKEVIDNSIDEFMQGNGRNITIQIEDETVTVRDYGRGIPLGKVIDCVAKLNTGAKYDSETFQRSIGMNGVGVKAVNALSSRFVVESIRDGQLKRAEFSEGKLIADHPLQPTTEWNGTRVSFTPDNSIFPNYHFRTDYVEKMIKYYTYLNRNLIITLNGKKYTSKNGLADLLADEINEETLYPVVHEAEGDCEFALTHTAGKYGEVYFTFVNGQHTTQGGTHQQAFREGIVKAVREFYKKDYDPADIRNSIIAALTIRVQEPVFESQTKTKLGSIYMDTENVANRRSIRTYVVEIVSRLLNNHLHRNPEMANVLQNHIQEAERERKQISSIKKANREKIKKISLNNNKLRDCTVHYNTKDALNAETTLFITEGDSATGSITKSRNPKTQAVFSLRGKPLNTFNLSKAEVYQNNEFNLLQAALNIEDGIEGLRYNNIVIATDADVDGMHIRLLLLTYFLQFFPELIQTGHLYILQTPLFRVRNTKRTIYCYSEEEKLNAITACGSKAEITRFKGLGEISPDEFRGFIGENIRLDPVILNKDIQIRNLLQYYMGKNTAERFQFISENLRTDIDTMEVQNLKED